VLARLLAVTAAGGGNLPCVLLSPPGTRSASCIPVCGAWSPRWPA